jgi:hypothetical protein
MAAKRRLSWTTLVLAGCAVAFASLVGAYLWAIRQVVHAYYVTEYQPERLDAALPAVPPRARLTDVPALRSPLERGPALAMQMLAAQQGRALELSTIELAMGTTWGATGRPRQLNFFPGGDEDLGFRVGAPSLGFTRRYLVTDDAARYLAELKAQLARGRAVRVLVDLPTLQGQPPLEEASPRDLVLIGYDGDWLEYDDPVCAGAAPCEAGAAGAPGVKVTSAALLEAVDRQALHFKYPWTYQLLVLEPASGEPPGLGAALERDAKALIGFKQGSGGPSTGAFAVSDVASVAARSGDDAFGAALEKTCALAASVRAADAAAVRALFPGELATEAGAKKLELAASAYERARQAFGKKEIFGLTDALLAAAAADQEAGAALLTRTAR